MYCKMYMYNCTLYPGAEFGITSDEFFLLKSRPEQVLVVGAGYIAVEMSQVFIYTKIISIIVPSGMIHT
jgi:pyruvate/2-oxoglutarate dehydrogenase complex dihydrolipoamide dehydrogenase (E3) component